MNLTPYPLRLRRRVLLLVLLALGLLISLPSPSRAQAEGPVYVVEVTGTIDLGLAPYIERVLEQAEEEDGTVVLHIDTPGGRLDAALEIRRALLASDVPTIALVDPNALSAGALIAIATDEIHVVEGAVIGAATPVTGAGETADEKTISAVEAIFRATAEAQGRNPEVAAAMVDPGVEIEGLVEEGELLTLSVPEALEWGYAEAVVDGLEGTLAEAGLANAEVVRTAPSPAEAVVRWLTNPVVSSLLLTVGIWLVVGDVLSGGVGIGVVAGLASIGLFFWGHLLAGLAGWEDVALVVLGLVLIALEITVIPGTGIAGSLGLAAFLGGAFLAMLGRDLTTGEQVQRALGTVAGSLVLIVAGAVALFAFLARGGGPRGLVLREAVGEAPAPQRRGWLRLLSQGQEAEPTAPTTEPASLEGAKGVAHTDLRPGGIAQVDGQRVDVVTEGEYLPAGTEVEVVADRTYRRVVRAIPDRS